MIARGRGRGRGAPIGFQPPLLPDIHQPVVVADVESAEPENP